MFLSYRFVGRCVLSADWGADRIGFRGVLRVTDNVIFALHLRKHRDHDLVKSVALESRERLIGLCIEKRVGRVTMNCQRDGYRYNPKSVRAHTTILNNDGLTTHARIFSV